MKLNPESPKLTRSRRHKKVQDEVVEGDTRTPPSKTPRTPKTPTKPPPSEIGENEATYWTIPDEVNGTLEFELCRSLDYVLPLMLNLMDCCMLGEVTWKG